MGKVMKKEGMARLVRSLDLVSSFFLFWPVLVEHQIVYHTHSDVVWEIFVDSDIEF